MAGIILVATTAALAALGVYLLIDAESDDCECGQPRWYHGGFWCDNNNEGDSDE